MLETPVGWVLLLLVGSVTGVLSGILGIGGGILMVPVLTFFGVPLVQATATSLVGVLLSATSGSIRNFSAGELNWRNSLVIAVFGMLTAQVGAWLGDRLADPILSLAFAVLLVATIRLIDLKRSLQHKTSPDAEASRLTASDVPSASRSIQWLPVIGIGLMAGFLSGMFGIGGGVVMVPLQMLLLAEPIKAAVRTSLGAIVPIAISGLTQHTLNDNVLWLPGLSLGVGGLLGAQVGTRMLPKLGDRTVNRLFRLFLIALAVYMVIRGVRGLM
ncbi:sulfite exporter TauE/SafE family protein [Vacuolonema iberomarrocanum]|uniref:sulfite exporter TauE/SafE family protein n=1 Tax=Vacuolonema iberomarrocanum TaxID=3454632 RepID=UPI001A01B1E7|nr:sulfite exporter TauE/SafE family protein [filamentous cyanobacterium LEGE 07170]